MTKSTEIALNSRAELGEGAFWDFSAERLLWVDIVAGEIHVFDPASGADSCVALGEHVGCVRPKSSGGWIVAGRRRFLSVHGAGDRAVVEEVAKVDDDRPSNGFNDGGCDPCGRFWAGTVADELTPEARSVVSTGRRRNRDPAGVRGRSFEWHRMEPRWTQDVLDRQPDVRSRCVRL